LEIWKAATNGERATRLQWLGWAGHRFGGPMCTLFLNNTSNYVSYRDVW